VPPVQTSFLIAPGNPSHSLAAFAPSLPHSQCPSHPSLMSVLGSIHVLGARGERTAPCHRFSRIKGLMGQSVTGFPYFSIFMHDCMLGGALLCSVYKMGRNSLRESQNIALYPNIHYLLHRCTFLTPHFLRTPPFQTNKARQHDFHSGRRCDRRDQRLHSHLDPYRHHCCSSRLRKTAGMDLPRHIQCGPDCGSNL
jgi:hypothetical protein